MVGSGAGSAAECGAGPWASQSWIGSARPCRSTAAAAFFCPRPGPQGGRETSRAFRRGSGSRWTRSEISLLRRVRRSQNVQIVRSGTYSGDLRALESPRIDDRRSPRGTGRAEIGLQRRLDEELGDSEARRDGGRVLAASRPPPDVAGKAHGLLPGTAHVELAAGGAPALPLLLGPRQRPQPLRRLGGVQASESSVSGR